jgi:hypothetical protein
MPSYCACSSSIESSTTSPSEHAIARPVSRPTIFTGVSLLSHPHLSSVMVALFTSQSGRPLRASAPARTVASTVALTARGVLLYGP